MPDRPDRPEKNLEAGKSAAAGGVSGKSEKFKKTAFLDALSAGVSASRAARLAGTTLRTVKRWRSASKSFSETWMLAEEAGTDAIEDEALRRAVEGTSKPVFRGGEVVGHVTDYSDAMLSMLLKARRPERYATQKQSGEHDNLDLSGAREALYSKFSQVVTASSSEAISDKPDGD